MIPENVELFTTEGERQVYRFFEAVAKPDPDYIVWYTPDVKGREPDFVLFCRNVGLVILEVKDWNLEQIVKVDPQCFTLTIKGKQEDRTNPSKQCKEYLYKFMDKIREDGRLMSKNPAFHGNPMFPLEHGVFFPNINKYEYTGKEFDRVLSAEKIFFWDDMHPESDICRDPTGNCFLETLTRMFPPRFKFKVTGKELVHLKQLIFPTVKIELPERNSKFPYPKRVNRLKGLDHHQEVLARKYDGGHRIITGPSGSGKTLVLVHKAAFLLKYNPDIKRILFVCYNITLVNYIKRMLANKHVPLGEEGVQVYHFFELCSEIIGEDVHYENEESGYYDLIVQEALERLEAYGNKFDAILVDEGQDFSDDMYRVVTSLLSRQTNNLTIALDDSQNIYNRHFSWKDVGVQARGRVHKISYVYRNTREIAELANRFKGAGEQAVPAQKELFPDFFDFSGPAPEIKQYASFEDILAQLPDKIIKAVETDQCPLSEIAIVYTTSRPAKDMKKTLPVLIEKALESRGILSNWVSENYRSKKVYDITTDRVTISTIHSVKGLDYSCVLLIGLDCFDTDRWNAEQIEKLTYVAITRARYQLFIPYIHATPFISRLLLCNNRE